MNKRVKCKCGRSDINFEKTYTYVVEIFVSQTSHQNPVGINTIALVSSWENVWERRKVVKLPLFACKSW